MRGFENFLMDLHEHPEFVEELLDGILAIHLEAIELIAKRLKVDAIFGGDDFCDQRGVIMGEKLWRGSSSRAWRNSSSAATTWTCRWCCIPAATCCRWWTTSWRSAWTRWSRSSRRRWTCSSFAGATEGRMVLVGGLGVQYMMPFGRPEEVTAHVRRLMTEMTRKGGYVLAAAKPLRATPPRPTPWC